MAHIQWNYSGAVTTFISPTASAFSSVTFDITVSSVPNRILVITTFGEDQTASPTILPITSMTFNGIALTKIAAINCDGATIINSDRLEMWYMLNPPIGTYTLSVTYAGAQTFRTGVASVVLYNAKQQAPEAVATTVNPYSNSVTTISTNITTITPNAVIIDALQHPTSSAVVTANSPQQQLYSYTVTTSSHGSGSSALEKLVPGTYNVGWTANFPDAMNHIVAAFAPAPFVPFIITGD